MTTPLEQPPHDQDPMAEGLRAAFGGAPAPSRPSVLRLLQQQARSRLDLHLHDTGEPADPPVRIDDEARALRDPTDRYQILGEIGRGGVGVVYKGRDQDLGRDVAVKVLRPEHVDRPEVVERFVEEAQIGGQLQHPGIVPVYDLGLQHGARPYFAMKLVKGETLAALLARRTRPDEDRRRLLGIFEQVCQTLAYAHARRVVHRDLKPQNIMLGSFGEVQVVDWGFAKVLPEGEPAHRPPAAPAASVIHTIRSDPDKGTHSVVGSMLGTPAYMAPEQAIGDVAHVDRRSDVFGLGAILCEILTGQPPYREQDGDLIQQAARADLQGAYERIQRSGTDAALAALCTQCLAPAPKARPESARPVADAVGRYLSAVEERTRQARIHAAEARVRARSILLLSAAAMLLLFLGGGGYLYVQRQTQIRRDQASQRVAAALHETNVRLGEARAAGIADLGLWTRAADAAAQAETLAGEADVSGQQRAAATALRTRILAEQEDARARAARIARDQAMRQRLLEVRIPSDADHDPIGLGVREARRRDASYAAAFRQYLDGRDLATMTVAAGAAALAGDMAVELAAALDHWAFGRLMVLRAGQAGAPDAETTARLQAVAAALDADPWRNQLRTVCAREQANRDALVRLQAEADLRSLPVVSLALLASALQDAGAADAARAVYRTACERYPTDFGSVFALGRLHEAAKEYRQAVDCFRIARALQPGLREVRHQLGMALGMLGDRKGDLRTFRELAQEEPDNAHWQFHLGVLSETARKHEDAIAFYRRSIALDPTYGMAHTNLGAILEGLKRSDEAVEVYRRALEIDVHNADAHSGLGVALTGQGRTDEAIDSFRRALDIDPELAKAHHGLGTALAAQGRRDEAIASYRRAIAFGGNGAMSSSNLAATHYNLGQHLWSQGKHDEAIASLRDAVRVDPKLAAAHSRLGHALWTKGQPEEAIACFRRAIGLDPKRAADHRRLGALLLDQGRLDDSVACLRRATELDAGEASAHANLGQALVRQGKLDEAIPSLRRAVELEPTQARAHAQLADALRRQGQLDEAVAAFRSALELDPASVFAWHNLGVALASRGSRDEAIACYRRTLELDPKVALCHANLGFALGERGDADEAIACFRRALELAPEEGLAHEGLGVALSQQGRTDEALASLRRAAEAWSRDERAAERLGRVKKWIDQLEAWSGRSQELLALARGEGEAGTDGDLVAAAGLVHRRGEHLLAARTYARAFTAFPALLSTWPHRYRAACAAALAGCGKGEGAAGLTDAERAKLREEARGWLAAEIVRWRQALAAGGARARTAGQQLADAVADRNLDLVRGEKALQELPTAEAEAWRALWKQVADLQASAAREDR